MRLIMFAWMAMGILAGAVTTAAEDLPCNLNGYALREPVVKVNRLGAPSGDESLRFKAVLALPESASFDPATTGLRLIMLDNLWGSDDVVLDVAAPSGSAWRTSATGTWAYRATARGTSGITRAVVKRIAPNLAYVVSKQYSVAIEARRGSYASTSDLESHFLMLAFAATGPTQECAVRPFYPWLLIDAPGGGEPYEAAEWMPACKFRGDGRTLECTSGPRVGPCRVSTPNDLLLCDVQNAAAAEERYRADTGSYYDGPCEGLPGFRPSPDVTCTANATPDGFSIHTTSPKATYLSGCTWDSGPSDNLACL